MNNRYPLVPTPIVNKNGVQTTVHKKPQSSPASDLSSVPPSVKITPRQLDNLRQEVVNSLYGPASKSTSNAPQHILYQQFNRVFERVSRYPVGMLNEIAEITNDNIRIELFLTLSEGSESEKSVRDWVSVAPAISQGKHYYYIYPVVRAFAQYEEDGLPSQSDMQKRAIHTEAIIRATYSISDFDPLQVTHGGNTSTVIEYIADQQIRTILATHDDPLMVAALIEERQITSGSRLQVLLEARQNIAPSVIDGSL